MADLTEPGSRGPALLILGGTGEARALAAALATAFGERLRVITSLAGRVKTPAVPEGELRVGGFGGVDGLAQYLAAEGIAALVDATHPFAAEISAHAVAACAQTETPRMVLTRPAWRQQRGDRWLEVDDMAAAATTLAALAEQENRRRIFVTTGARRLDALRHLNDNWVLVRLVETPAAMLPLPRHRLILGRGPFDLAGERALMAEHEIDALLTKAAGGGATEAKITAARELGLPVVMIRRPPLPAGPATETVEDIIGWAARTLGPAAGPRHCV